MEMEPAKVGSSRRDNNSPWKINQQCEMTRLDKGGWPARYRLVTDANQEKV